jgi:protein O-GlcNAc transferase
MSNYLLENILIQAMNLLKKGQLDHAELKYKEVLHLDKRNFDAYYFLSRIAYDKKNYNLGMDLILKAIKLNPNVAQAHNTLGTLYRQLENYVQAVKSFRKTIELDKYNFEGYVNLGSALIFENKYEEALKNFKAAIDIKKDHFMPYSNIGFCLLDLGRFEEALPFLNKAIVLKPDYPLAYIYRAKVKENLNELDSSLIDFNVAISINTNAPEYYYERGLFFLRLKDFSKAVQDFEKVYSLNPKYETTVGNILYASSCLFDFKKNNDFIDKAIIDIKNNIITTEPIGFLFISDDINLQFRLVTNCSKDINRKVNLDNVFKFNKNKNNNKIKVAYFSSDFADHHPIGRQVSELFELHDRNIFEIFLFSLKENRESLLKKRLINSCDHYINVDNKTYLEIVTIARSLNISIAVDLNGYSSFAKTQIFFYRVAPIQINYLGFPGSMGSDVMDYLIADKTVIPRAYLEKYAEKIIYLPNCYQVNDRLKKISEQKFLRSDFGLKDDQFVFCCFNSSYKITENIFRTWVKILKKVPNSVLWLLEPNKIAKINIVQELKKNGIFEEKVLFLKRLEHSAYLGIHCLADLYLDTFPYNAHSTASESLWSGLPLLTLMGQSFHSRVAASILNSAGLPELITDSLESYEKLAVELALNPEKLTNIKKKLKNNIKTSELFNTSLYTKNLEKAYKQIYDRYLSNKKPEHIYI